MSAKPKKKAAKKKPARLTAHEVRGLVADLKNQFTCESESIFNRLQSVLSAVRSLESRQKSVEIALDSTMSNLVHRLALFGDFKHIPESEGQRLMSVSQGEMTPVYIDWYIATHTREESRKKYDGRIHHLPPYLRDKIQ